MPPKAQLIAEARLHLRNTLDHFMPPIQKAVLEEGLRSEDAPDIAMTIIQIAKTVSSMPHTYQTDGQGESAIVHLHYFHGGMDWYITEKDQGDQDTSDMRQHQAFGLANMGEPEFGYISIEELIQNGIELDLHWTPKALKEVM